MKNPVLTLFLFTLTPIAVFAGPLVNFNDSWRYRPGTSAPQADWKTVGEASLDAS